jgi:hypothetical protein
MTGIVDSRRGFVDRQPVVGAWAPTSRTTRIRLCSGSIILFADVVMIKYDSTGATTASDIEWSLSSLINEKASDCSDAFRYE